MFTHFCSRSVVGGRACHPGRTDRVFVRSDMLSTQGDLAVKQSSYADSELRERS